MEIWPPMAERVSESQGETPRRHDCKKGRQGCAALCWWTTENENKHKNQKKKHLHMALNAVWENIMV